MVICVQLFDDLSIVKMISEKMLKSQFHSKMNVTTNNSTDNLKQLAEYNYSKTF